MKYVFLLFLLPLYMCSIDKSPVYTDFAIHRDTLWRLDFKGHIFPIDMKTQTKIFHPLLNWRIAIAITCDNVNRLIICDNNNNIVRINLVENTWDQLYTCSGTVTGITCDAKNNIYVITQSGIIDITTQHTYAIALPWNRPPRYIMDQKDNIWLGFNIDGKKGNVYIFDTNDKTFYQPDFGNLDMEHRSIVSFFKGKTSNEMYGTSQYINGNVVTYNLVQFYKRTGRVLLNTPENVKLQTGVCYQDHIFIGNSMGEISTQRQGKWKTLFPAEHKTIDKMYTDGHQFIYLTRDGTIHIKSCWSVY